MKHKLTRCPAAATVAAALLLCHALAAQPAILPEVGLPVLDVNAAAFPRTDLVDFSPALQAPAGTHGFLFVGTDGHLYFQDGTPGRFWGINVAKDAVFVPSEVVDQVVATLAAAGFNLVRLHHVDGVTGLLPPERAGTEERLDPEKLDMLHYWVHALKERGIHVYLDLLDFRTFQEAEGVADAEALGRGAKPAAVFNERLIELQVDYARELLFEKPNPYTGLPLGHDPAVVMVELCDENGLFRKLAKLREMPAQYMDELRRRWNFWLRAEYGSTPELAQAWVRPDGRSALGPGETLEESSVRLTVSPTPEPDFPSPTGGGLPGTSTASRQRDVRRFCQSIHLQYFARMKQALREGGLRAPLTAVTDWDEPADLRSVVEGLDFVGCNWYYDHPVFRAGNEWHLPSFFTNINPLADEQGLDFVCSVTKAAVKGKPLVVREWGACWPSKFRGVGTLEGAAYAALQDIDAMILFTYDTRPDSRRTEYFDISSDPVRWGIAGLAGEIYRTRAVSPARKRVALGMSREDSLAEASPAVANLVRLGWASQVRQLLFNEVCEEVDADLVVAAGLSGAQYVGQRVLFPGRGAVGAAYQSGYGAATRTSEGGAYTFNGIGYDLNAQVELPPGVRFSVADLQAEGLEPIGLSPDGTLACGFWDPTRANCALLNLGHEGLLRGALDLLGMNDAHPAAPSHGFVDRQEHVADTGELRRDLRAERLLIDTPRVKAVAGALGGTVQAGSMRVSTASPLGVVAALALDEGGSLLVKMVTVAANTGEKKSPREAGGTDLKLQLEAFGDAPVLTHGEASDTPTTVELDGKPVVSVYMVNGTWEAVRKGEAWYVWCDTPGVKVSLPGLGEKVTVTPFGAGGAGEARASGQPFAYPEGCRFVGVEGDG